MVSGERASEASEAREMGTRTARDTVHVATRLEPEHVDAIAAAAAECGLRRGTWIRIVLLAAAGVSPVRDQLTRATRRAREVKS